MVRRSRSQRHSHTLIANGRVVSLGENGITTSEGQGYTMLPAVSSTLLAGLLTAWEKSQRRTEECIFKPILSNYEPNNLSIQGTTQT
jgi:hypothetical protein